MQFPPFPTINSLLSNVAELRRQSHHVVAISMGNLPAKTRRDGASELPHSNEGCKPTQCGTPFTPQARGPAVAEFKYGSPTELKRRGVTSI
jgi:hypothetical protein